MSKEEQKQIYVVLVKRKDDDHIVALESPNFSDCKKVWKELYEQWQICHQESRAFVLDRPIVTAFEPGLISEITVIPKQYSQLDVDDDNPYKQMMLQKGLGHSLKGLNTHYRGAVDEGKMYPDLLDGGYK